MKKVCFYAFGAEEGAGPPVNSGRTLPLRLCWGSPAGVAVAVQRRGAVGFGLRGISPEGGMPMKQFLRDVLAALLAAVLAAWVNHLLGI